jgi:hypothetical protein
MTKRNAAASSARVSSLSICVAFAAAMLAFAAVSDALGGQTSEDCLVRAKAVRTLVVSNEPSHQVFRDRIGKAEQLCRSGETEQADKILASVEQDLQAGGTNQ